MPSRKGVRMLRSVPTVRSAVSVRPLRAAGRAACVRQGDRTVIEASPTVWRRWLASELRRMRSEAGLEQKLVAQARCCTVTKVSYFETAQRPGVPRDLDEILLPLYTVPEERWPMYLDAADAARHKGWWETYDEDVLP